LSISTEESWVRSATMLALMSGRNEMPRAAWITCLVTSHRHAVTSHKSRVMCHESQVASHVSQVTSGTVVHCPALHSTVMYSSMWYTSGATHVLVGCGRVGDPLGGQHDDGARGLGRAPVEVLEREGAPCPGNDLRRGQSQVATGSKKENTSVLCAVY